MPRAARDIKSSVQTASAQITSSPGKLRDITIVSDGSNAGVVRFLDGTPITLNYDSGGVTEPVLGETVTGASSGRTGTIAAYTTASGTWAGGDAAGVLTIIIASGATAFTDDEALNGSSAGANFATADGAGTAGSGGTEIWRGAVGATAGTVVSLSFPEGRSFKTALYLYAKDIGSISVGYSDNS